MRSARACLAAAVLLAALAGCHAGSPQTAAPAAAVPDEAAAPEEGAPVEGAGLPATPPEYACRVDADCVLAQHSRAVAASEDCACPGCPQPLNREVAAAHEAAFEEHCGAWAAEEGCAAPFCSQLPGEVSCIDGRCGLVLGARRTVPAADDEAPAAAREVTMKLAVGDRIFLAEKAVSVLFEGVVADSRCPEGATCVWAGDATVALRIAAAGREDRHLVHTNVEPRSVAVTGLGRLFLDELAPLPRQGEPPPGAASIATLRLEPEGGS